MGCFRRADLAPWGRCGRIRTVQVGRCCPSASFSWGTGNGPYHGFKRTLLVAGGKMHQDHKPRGQAKGACMYPAWPQAAGVHPARAPAAGQLRCASCLASSSWSAEILGKFTVRLGKGVQGEVTTADAGAPSFSRLSHQGLQIKRCNSEGVTIPVHGAPSLGQPPGWCQA